MARGDVDRHGERQHLYTRANGRVGGLVTTRLEESSEGPARKYYRLTPKGRKQLAVETTKWETLARAIARVLRPA